MLSQNELVDVPLPLNINAFLANSYITDILGPVVNVVVVVIPYKFLNLIVHGSVPATNVVVACLTYTSL